MKSRGCTIEFRVSKILSFLIILCFFSRSPQSLRCWPAASREGRCWIWILNSHCSTAILSSTGICTCKVQFPDDLCLNTITFPSSVCYFLCPLSDFLDFFFPFLKLSALSSSWWQTVVWHPQRLLLRMTCWFAAMGTPEQGQHLPLTHRRAQATVPCAALLLVKVCPPLFHKRH